MLNVQDSPLVPVRRCAIGAAGLFTCLAAGAAGTAGSTLPDPPSFPGIPVDFILFALTLLGVALFHHHTLHVALTGLAAITPTSSCSPASRTARRRRPRRPSRHEWVILANLFVLLMGFALLSRHFEKSRMPAVLPRFLPDDWKGGFVLLVMVFVLSSFLDNIAAALIGGTMAHAGVPRQGAHRLPGRHRRRLQRRRLGQRGRRHHHHHDVDRRREPAQRVRGLRRGRRCAGGLRHSGGACSSSGIRRSSRTRRAASRIDWARVFIVALILSAAIVANVVVNVQFTETARAASR